MINQMKTIMQEVKQGSEVLKLIVVIVMVLT